MNTEIKCKKNEQYALPSIFLLIFSLHDSEVKQVSSDCLDYQIR